jgi:hypothetical protein
MTDPRTTGGLVRYFLYLSRLGFGGPVGLPIFWLRGAS